MNQKLKTPEYWKRFFMFMYWADHYGLVLIEPKYKVDDNNTDWAE
jgi:hypothetical protein